MRWAGNVVRMEEIIMLTKLLSETSKETTTWETQAQIGPVVSELI
jgi:hypothetical protein